MTIVFMTMVGMTTVPKSAANGPGKPTIKYADVRNKVPDTSVPTAVKMDTLTTFVNFLAISKYKAKR